MKPHWIIDETAYSNDNNVAQRMHYVLRELGVPVTTCKYTPFGSMDWGFLPEEGPLVYYGLINAVLDVKERGLTPPCSLRLVRPRPLQMLDILQETRILHPPA